MSRPRVCLALSKYVSEGVSAHRTATSARPCSLACTTLKSHCISRQSPGARSCTFSSTASGVTASDGRVAMSARRLQKRRATAVDWPHTPSRSLSSTSAPASSHSSVTPPTPEAAAVAAVPAASRPSLLDYVPVPPPRPLPYNWDDDRFVAILIRYSGQPGACFRLVYFVDGGVYTNGLDALHEIAESNTDERLSVLFLMGDGIFELSGQRVLSLLDETDVEKLRQALTTRLTRICRMGGRMDWADVLSSGEWRLSDLKQQLLPGLIPALPTSPPAGLPFEHYATELFVRHLRDYIQCDAEAVAALRDAIINPPFQRYDAKEQSLLNFVQPVYAAFSTSLSASDCTYVVVFTCHDGGSPMLTYLQLEPAGNREAIERLRAIAATCEYEDFEVKVWPDESALSHETVQRLMAMGKEAADRRWQLIKQGDFESDVDTEQYRQALTAALPDGPTGDGWGNRDQWTAAELLHELLPGQVALLPLERPVNQSCKEGDYATQVFMDHWGKFVRPPS